MLNITVCFAFVFFLFLGFLFRSRYIHCTYCALCSQISTQIKYLLTPTCPNAFSLLKAVYKYDFWYYVCVCFSSLLIVSCCTVNWCWIDRSFVIAICFMLVPLSLRMGQGCWLMQFWISSHVVDKFGQRWLVDDSVMQNWLFNYVAVTLQRILQHMPTCEVTLARVEYVEGAFCTL